MNPDRVLFVVVSYGNVPMFSHLLKVQPLPHTSINSLSTKATDNNPHGEVAKKDMDILAGIYILENIPLEAKRKKGKM